MKNIIYSIINACKLFVKQTTGLNMINIIRGVIKRAFCLFSYPFTILYYYIKMLWRFQNLRKANIIYTRGFWKSHFLKIVNIVEEYEEQNLKIINKIFKKGQDKRFIYEKYNMLLPNNDGSEYCAVNDFRQIIFENIYESEYTEIKTGDIVIDCGANIGVFAQKALNQIGQDGKIVCVEPVESICKILMSNLNIDNKSINPERIIVNKPIYDSVKNVEMLISQESFTAHKIVEGKDIKNIKIVETTTIDNIVAEYKLKKVDYIKMDIEGAEFKALIGASKTLVDFKPKLVICIYHLQYDFIRIPELIIKINPKYLVYVKKDVCFAY